MGQSTHAIPSLNSWTFHFIFSFPFLRGKEWASSCVVLSCPPGSNHYNSYQSQTTNLLHLKQNDSPLLSLSDNKQHSKDALFQKKTKLICSNFCVVLYFLLILSCQPFIRTPPHRGLQAVQQYNVSFAVQWTIISFWCVCLRTHSTKSAYLFPECCPFFLHPLRF